MADHGTFSSRATSPAFRPAGSTVFVTFHLPQSVAVRHAELVAEFAGWTRLAMDRLSDGADAVTVGSERGDCWRCRFFADDRWVAGGRCVRSSECDSEGGGGNTSVVFT